MCMQLFMHYPNAHNNTNNLHDTKQRELTKVELCKGIKVEHSLWKYAKHVIWDRCVKLVHAWPHESLMLSCLAIVKGRPSKTHSYSDSHNAITSMLNSFFHAKMSSSRCTSYKITLRQTKLCCSRFTHNKLSQMQLMKAISITCFKWR